MQTRRMITGGKSGRAIKLTLAQLQVLEQESANHYSSRLPRRSPIRKLRLKDSPILLEMYQQVVRERASDFEEHPATVLTGSRAERQPGRNGVSIIAVTSTLLTLGMAVLILWAVLNSLPTYGNRASEGTPTPTPTPSATPTATP